MQPNKSDPNRGRLIVLLLAGAAGLVAVAPIGFASRGSEPPSDQRAAGRYRGSEPPAQSAALDGIADPSLA